MRMESIRFDQLTLRQEDGFEPFAGLSFDFPMFGIVQLRGRAGSGKSTLLRLLAGLIEPSEGAYLINGVDVGGMTFEEFNPYRRQMGFGFELGGLLANRTIKQNLLLPFSYHGEVDSDEAEARVDEYCARFGLEAVKELRPASISGGLKKAACVARALITEPQLLLLDNPLAGLDEIKRGELAALIRRQKERGTLQHVFVAGDLPTGIEPSEGGLIEIQDHALRVA